MVVGAELELEKSIQSVADLVRAASGKFSLIKYICAGKEILLDLPGFDPLVEKDNLLVLRKRSYP